MYMTYDINIGILLHVKCYVTDREQQSDKRRQYDHARELAMPTRTEGRRACALSQRTDGY